MLGHQRFAVSLRGEDVGYMDLFIEPLGDDSLIVTQRTEWELILMGQRQTVLMEIEAVTGPDLDLGGMSFSLDNGPTRIQTRTTRQGDSLLTEIESAGRTMSLTSSLGGAAYVPAIVDVAASSMSWVEGQVRTFPTFDPTTGTVNDATVTCTGHQEVELLGDPVDAVVLEISHLGTTTTAWVRSGEIVEERESNFNMVLTRVPPDQGGESFGSRDLYDVFAVPSTRIEDPRSLGQRAFRLEGEIDWEGFELEYPPIQFANPPVVIVKAEVPSPALILSREALDQATAGGALDGFLSGDPMIQSTDPSIVHVADSLVGDTDDSWEAARALASFVHDALEKTPTVSLPSAVEVLESRKGDCNEHTVLFVALARAAGIPARTCAGIVYLFDRFGYHAWPMVYVGEWVAMDPTLDQHVADATHIILATGNLEAQQVITSAMGRLSIVELTEEN